MTYPFELQLSQVYELASGTLLCSFLFNFGLTSVTLDLPEQWIFVGAGNGNIFQVNLQSKVHWFKLAQVQTILNQLEFKASVKYFSLGFKLSLRVQFSDVVHSSVAC